MIFFVLRRGCKARIRGYIFRYNVMTGDIWTGVLWLDSLNDSVGSLCALVMVIGTY